jgi:hypothetical protein
MPKDVDGVVWCTESLHTLITLHAVVEPRGHAVNAQIRILDEGRRCPLSSFNRIMRFHMAIDCYIIRNRSMVKDLFDGHVAPKSKSLRSFS